MATVVGHVPRRSYVLRLGNGKSIAISEGGLGGPARFPVTIGIFRCGWFGWFTPLSLFRPLWRWDISEVRNWGNPEDKVQEILEYITDNLLACNTMEEVVDVCRGLSDSEARMNTAKKRPWVVCCGPADSKGGGISFRFAYLREPYDDEDGGMVNHRARD